MKNSKAFKAASAAYTVAFAKFDAIRNAYRAKQIGDVEFCAAFAEHKAALAALEAVS